MKRSSGYIPAGSLVVTFPFLFLALDTSRESVVVLLFEAMHAFANKR